MYNEHDVILKSLTKIHNYLTGKYKHEIILVDDCSKDNSCDLVNKFRLKHKRTNITLRHNKTNKGKGYSILKGLVCAEGDYFLITDADLSTPIRDIEKLMKYKEDYSLIAGSRYLKESIIKKKQPILRIIYSRIYNRLVNFLFNFNIKDTQCGFKLIDKDLRDLIIEKAQINRHSFDPEWFLICKANNLHYTEVPVEWSDRKPKKASFKQVKEMFIDLLRINDNDIFDQYN